MKVHTPEIAWHNRDPIYSLDFQYRNGTVHKLASAGVDKAIRLWEVKRDDEGRGYVEFLANLIRHSRPVNVVRFCPTGNVLASAGDESVIFLWRQKEQDDGCNPFRDDEEESENKEFWTCYKMLRGHLEDIYDLSWSRDGTCIASASVDNSAILWNIERGEKLAIFSEHKSFVQGVAWDPCNQFVATLSTDRICRVYNINTKKVVHRISKFVTNIPQPDGTTNKKVSRMFHDDSMGSFVRRLTFTPDGELMLTPAGCVEMDDKTVNSSYIFTRTSMSKPVAHLPGPQKPTVAIRCCPVYFELRKAKNGESDGELTKPLFDLPYRIVFAVATEDSVLFYDTQQTIPFALISNIHYHRLSDLAWSEDGSILMISSTDGYCTFVTFDPEELGTPSQQQPKVTSQKMGETPLANEKPTELQTANQKSPEPVVVNGNHDETANKQPAAVPKANPIQVRSAGGSNGARRIAFTTLSNAGTTSQPASSGSPQCSSSTQAVPVTTNQTAESASGSTNQAAQPTSTNQGVAAASANQLASPSSANQGTAPRRIAFTTLGSGGESKPSTSGSQPRRVALTTLTASGPATNQSAATSTAAPPVTPEALGSGDTEASPMETDITKP
ncbi:chromatin assembly factor 1 subunit B-like isoform X2 [Branchiostoma lanceolatum]|uniref:chromatin assembly factor 1 subunit B-like isoform X2 n=1 Tax=Branchiostoma lanceolatum TaxID=7740 RepID=UPI003454510D